MSKTISTTTSTRPREILIQTLVQKPQISLIIPVLNEAEIITKNLKTLSDFMEKENKNYEIIVCDDYSQDQTYKKLINAKVSNQKITILRFNRRIGKGGTIKKAIEIASGKILIIVDADLSTNLKHIPEIARIAEKENAVVLGERALHSRYSQGYLRAILSLTYNLLVRSLFKTKIKDHQCGFKALPKEVAKHLAKRIRENGYLFDTELIILAEKLGIPVKKFDVEWREKRVKGRSAAWWIKASVEMLFGLINLKFRQIRLKTNRVF